MFDDVHLNFVITSMLMYAMKVRRHIMRDRASTHTHTHIRTQIGLTRRIPIVCYRNQSFYLAPVSIYICLNERRKCCKALFTVSM